MVCPRTTFQLGVPLLCAAITGLAGCSVDLVVILPGFEDPIAEDGDDDGDDGDTDDGSDDSSQHEPIPDPPNHSDPFGLACSVDPAGIDAPLPCDAEAPTDIIEPVEAWSWNGPGGEDSVLVTPLVANLDDDNGDEFTDLCDHPDVLVVAVDLPDVDDRPMPGGHIYVIDSATGLTKLRFERAVDPTATPAIADLDGDGIAEIVAFERSEDLNVTPGTRRVIAFAATGELIWVGHHWSESTGGGGLAIADLDADGSPEILTPAGVLDADGDLLWEPGTHDAPPSDALPTTVDLDLDGRLEVLYGRTIYEADGSFRTELDLPGGHNSGVAAVVNIDDDPYPEIYVQSINHRFYDDDGSVLAGCGAGGSGGLPASFADIDDDGTVELLTQHGGRFNAKTLVPNGAGGYFCVPRWEPIKIGDSIASATAFDFLGDGSAEPIYADNDSVRIFDDAGLQIASIERPTRAISTAIPVVVDADNDGAAEIIIASSEPKDDDDFQGERASIKLFQNSDDRFAPTRRIWNQHAYHATNIREDASVPAVQPHHWEAEGTNVFRANPAPTYHGQMCQSPVVE